MSHLLSLSIGPVQDFIAAARKCRELWFGSWMLSEISKAAALAIVDSEGNLESLVFPAPRKREELSPDSELSVANKILARCQDPAKAAEAAFVASKQRLTQLFDKASEGLSGSSYDAKSAKAQIEDLLEITWAAVPWTGSWSNDRKNVEALLASRKNTRDFKPVSWGGSRPKSSLDGQRESVLELTNEALAQRLGVRGGEVLCAVSLLKRRGQRGQGRQFSTSHVAAQPILRQLSPEHQRAVDLLIKSLKELGASDDDLGNVPREHAVFRRYDGRVLFEERLVDILTPEKLPTGQAALKNFLKETRVKAPMPYFAILLADGDRIGQQIDSHRSDAESREFTRKLAAFAGQANRVIKDHEGWPIYVGGDDVLALLPADRAVACGAELDKCFREQVPKASLSGGIAVVHHLEFLGSSLDYARALEAKAKVEGKKKSGGAVCLGISKRSGGEVEIVGTWAEAQARLAEAHELMRDDEVSHGLPYELRRLCDEVSQDSDELLVEEARRIIERKQPRGAGAMSQRALESLIGKLADRASVTALSSDLIVAKELLAIS